MEESIQVKTQRDEIFELRELTEQISEQFEIEENGCSSWITWCLNVLARSHRIHFEANNVNRTDLEWISC